MFKMLLVDDHAIVRHGLRQILEDEFPGAIFGEAEDAGQALERIHADKWSIVLLDLNMPGRSGMDVLKEIKQSSSGLPVLVLSMYPEDQYAMRVIKSGASGYMTKETAPEKLVDAVKKILDGGKYISESLAEKLAYEVGADIQQEGHKILSDREFEILQLIGKGLTVQGIAEKLKLSPKTIDTYRRRLLDKMKMNNNAELMRYALKHKIVE